MSVVFRHPALRRGDPALAAKLRRRLRGEVLFDPADRARYATDASIYDIEPLGVVCPLDADDLEAALDVAREEGIPVLARGAGTSQAGQTVGEALVLDCSRHMRRILEIDPERRTARVEPGVVLDVLDRTLKPYGLFYPVDVSTASRATLGGMTANDSAGARSLAYGVSVDRVLAVSATLADGTRLDFGPVPGPEAPQPGGRLGEIVAGLRAIAARAAGEIRRRWPRTLRNVAGYHLDRISPDGPFNAAAVLVGSEGTLALFREITLSLEPIPPHALLGVCRFPSLGAAMRATPAIVGLGPTAVELVDRTILELTRHIPAFAGILQPLLEADTDCLLLVEFAGDARAPLERRLRELGELLGDLGHPRALLPLPDPARVRAVWEVRRAALDVVMSVKSRAKPVSFVEDCAVPLEHLADYVEALEEVFARHGTRGTWYAHASVGCLHVRPLLDLSREEGVRAMRAIAEEAVELVRRLGGSHSGEHGDGLVRSEFHPKVLGEGLAAAFAEVKRLFDPAGILNTRPSKIVDPPPMDDRRLLRWKPDDRPIRVRTRLDWSAWEDGLLGAVEMCNGNGACRKEAGGVMCPSFRITREERHATRGRAQLLRRLLRGRLPDGVGLDHPAVLEALELCVSCKACRRECPTGVDMARLKIEVLAERAERAGLSAFDRLVAHMPELFRAASLAPGLAAGVAALVERSGLPARLGFAAERPLPRVRRPFRAPEGPVGEGPREVVLFVDCFSRFLEPEVPEAALRLLARAGFRVRVVSGICCSRPRLAVGLVERARRDLARLAARLDDGTEAPILGLEPSCLFTLADELPALLPGVRARRIAARARLVQQALAEVEVASDRAPAPDAVLFHGHCHEKAFGAAGATAGLLERAFARVEVVDSGCCGMAGAFGYRAATLPASAAMAELALWPAVRGSDPSTRIAATGISCRQQIAFGTGRRARHPLVHLAEVWT